MRRPLLSLFAAGDRLAVWRRRCFTDAGGITLAMIGIAGALSIGASGSRLDLLAMAAAVLIAIATPPAVIFPHRGRTVRVERQLPKFAVNGVPFTYRIQLHNTGIHRLPRLILRDQPAGKFPDAELFRLTREPHEGNRNRFDRAVGYRRWNWLVAHLRGIDVEPVALTGLSARGSAEIAMTALPRRRGMVHFDSVELAQPDPLGLVFGLHQQSLPQSLIVLPRCHPVRPLVLAGARRLQAGGSARAQSVGQTEEFLYLRDFRDGDSCRQIHWRSTARRNRPVVKESQDEYHQRFALIVDTFIKTGQDLWFEDLVEVAASIVATAHLGDSVLDLMFIGDRAYVVSAGRGLGMLETVLEVLAAVPAARDQSFDRLSDLVRRSASHLTGCLFLLLDWDPSRQALVQDVRALGVAIEVVTMVGPGAPVPPPGVLADCPGRLHSVPVGEVGPALAAMAPGFGPGSGVLP